MQGIGHQLLAHPAFTRDEHARLRIGHLPDALHQPGHLLAFPDNLVGARLAFELFQFLFERLVLVIQLAVGKSPADH
ncbi:hypothetical protein SDC9_176778 [bioreactor metagenome]|uniref:Uncharacterized protein n=1 Tax=bioreactor metagenome TaxID=1076179 RepID=A0A645GSY1_9ZZZZ